MTQQEIINAFAKYESIKIQIKKLEAELNEIKPLIEEYVPEDKKVPGEYGVFSKTKKSKWIFSQFVKDKEEQLDELKEVEKADGTAQKEVTYVLMYTENKGGVSKD